jgi:hypothetical protein
MIVRLDSRDVTIGVKWRKSSEDSGDGDEGEDSEKGAGCSWDLAYAISVHKSQGSEWPVCLVMVDASGGRIQSRQWIYTAISRAKHLCVTIGKRQAIEAAVRLDGINRKTFLRELIEENVAAIRRRKVAAALEATDWNLLLEGVA